MKAVLDRMRLLGAGLLLATFVAGALTGAAVDRLLTAEEAAAAVEGEDGEDDRRDRSYVIDSVEMTDAQRETIDRILENRTARMRSVWREVEPRLDAITDSARTEIMQVLTPEQRASYEQKLEERRGQRQ